ncbi:MAG: transposase [Rhodospirillales bacterium]|nr:transposase [Rhodospirillales bacterium]
MRGLLEPDGPKSVQPIAARLGLSDHDQLHRFVRSPAWDDAPLWQVPAERAGCLVGGDDAVLVIDDTALPKKETASGGEAAQYCGAPGKRANCQSPGSLSPARREVAVPVRLRPFLPARWTDFPARRHREAVRSHSAPPPLPTLPKAHRVTAGKSAKVVPDKVAA